MQVGTPAKDAKIFVPAPFEFEDHEALAKSGYMPAVPPDNYEGTIADWCVAMASLGGPFDYESLTQTFVRGDVWEEVLTECEQR